MSSTAAAAPHEPYVLLHRNRRSVLRAGTLAAAALATRTNGPATQPCHTAGRSSTTARSSGVLKLAVDLHPDSRNAFDGLGEAHAADDVRARALTACRQHLVLNPRNTNGVAPLALRAAPSFGPHAKWRRPSS